MQEAGLRVGDYLHKVNGQPLFDMPTFDAALSKLTALKSTFTAQAITFHVSREVRQEQKKTGTRIFI